MTRRRCGSRGVRRGLFVLLLVALAAPFLQAGAAEAPKPFADLDAIKIAVEVGGPLDLKGGTTQELFTDEVGRLSRFETTLSRSVGSKLESCGILWDEAAPNDLVSIFVFGRLEQPPEGPPLYVYMVRGEVLNSKVKDRSGSEPVPLRSVLGLASEAGLEAAIIDAAVAIVSDELGNCEES